MIKINFKVNKSHITMQKLNSLKTK